MAAGEQDRLDLSGEVDRDLYRTAEDAAAVVEQSREDELEAGEHLRQPHGGQREDETGNGEEPPDHQQVDRRAEQGGEGEAGAGCGPVRPVPDVGQLHREGGGRRADRHLGEVDDTGRPIDQYEAHGREGGQRTEDDAEKNDAGRNAPGEHPGQHGPGSEHPHDTDEEADDGGRVPHFGGGKAGSPAGQGPEKRCPPRVVT